MFIQLFRQTNLSREDIDAWRQDLTQNRGSIIGYLIITKYSHTMRKMTDIINCMKVDEEIKENYKQQDQTLSPLGVRMDLF